MDHNMPNCEMYMKPNKFLRRKANDTVGRNLGSLLLMLLIIMGISIGISMVTNLVQLVLDVTGISYTGTSVVDRSSIIKDYGAVAVEPSLDVFAEVTKLFESAEVTPEMSLLSLLVSFVSSWVLQTLYQGYMSGCIRMIRGEKVGVSCLFSRMGSILRVLGLNLWVGLLCFVWMLPGLAVLLIGAALAMAEEVPVMALIFLVVGLIVMLVMGLIASYRYAMAAWALADEPKKGVFQAVSRSVEITRYRKFQLFRLTVPHFLLMFLFIIVLMVNFVSLLVQPAVLMMLGVLASVIVLPVLLYAAMTLYTMCYSMALAAFYEKYNKKYEPECPSAPVVQTNPIAPAVPVVPAASAAPAAPAVPAVPATPESEIPAAPADPRPVIPTPEAPAVSDEPRPVIPAEPTAPLTPVAPEDILPPVLPVTHEGPEAPIDLADVLPPNLPTDNADSADTETSAQPE